MTAAAYPQSIHTAPPLASARVNPSGTKRSASGRTPATRRHRCPRGKASRSQACAPAGEWPTPSRPNPPPPPPPPHRDRAAHPSRARRCGRRRAWCGATGRVGARRPSRNCRSGRRAGLERPGCPAGPASCGARPGRPRTAAPPNRCTVAAVCRSAQAVARSPCTSSSHSQGSVSGLEVVGSWMVKSPGLGNEFSSPQRRYPYQASSIADSRMSLEPWVIVTRTWP